MRPKKWTEQKVIKAIQQRQRSGQSLSSCYQQDAALYATAKRLFGNWSLALQAAGLERFKRKWTRELVIEAIQYRYKQGLPVRNMCRHDGRLYRAAGRQFAGWDSALEAAGVSIAIELKWTRESILSQLQQFHRDGIPGEQLWRQDLRLTSTAARLFGSWKHALDAAELTSSRQSWSKRLVILELKRLRREGKRPDSRLKSAAMRHFGSLSIAQKAAKIHLPVRQVAHADWTPAMAVEAIRRREASGSNLSQTSKEDTPLFRASLRLWGTWGAALQAAGFPLRAPINWLTAEEVQRKIQDRLAKGQSLVNCNQGDPLLFGSAAKHFGGWRLALRAAGIETTIPQRRTKSWVIEAMRERHRQGFSMSRVWREDKQLFSIALHKFGSWKEAMLAAGFQPTPREKWTRQKIIDRLQAWKREYIDGTVRTRIPSLAEAATRHFGSLDTAMEAAGVEPPPSRWTDRRVIEAIQDRYIQGAQRQLIGFGDIRLSEAAKRRFGSWQQAVKQAGLADKVTVRKPLRRWSKETIIQAIQQWHAGGRELTDISKCDQGLYSVAKTQFGTWSKALAAAGFQSKRRRWNQSLIIAEIQKRMVCGETLSCHARVNHSLAPVASRYFGSWTKAVEAAKAQRKQVRGERSPCHVKM